MNRDQRIGKIIDTLTNGSADVKRNPSEANYKQWEGKIKRAARRPTNYFWWFFLIIIVVVTTIISYSSGREFKGNHPSYSSNGAISASETNLNMVSTLSISTLKPTAKPKESSCIGAPLQRMSINGRGYICTKVDRVIIRTGAGKSNSEITRKHPGTQFDVVGGPKCANNLSWWKIRTNDGIVGWIAEGGDDLDEYFICPQ